MDDAISNFYSQIQRDCAAALKNDPILGKLKKTDEDYLKSARTMLDPDHQFAKIALIEKELCISLKNQCLLEIGSGIGDFVVTCRRQGIQAYGIEAHDKNFRNLKRLSEKLISFFKIEDHIILEACGEAMPFRENSFDIVFSYYVYEHVQDPILVLSEAIRVLKPGGRLFFVFPNYGSFWEGHYGIPWIPFANKTMGKIWVRLWGRKPDFIDTLQLFNVLSLKNILHGIGDKAECLGLGKEKFIREVGDLSFTDAGSLGKVKKLLKPLGQVGVLPVLARTLAFFGMYTPFYLTLRKR